MKMHYFTHRAAAVALGLAVWGGAWGGAVADDWPCWGGSPVRNMVNDVEKNMPTEWDVTSGKNIKWSAVLGSQTYGNPVIADGKVFVGTNNEGMRDPNIKDDEGVYMCFGEADGTFRWQALHDKLAAGRVNDWPRQGVCSTMFVEDDRAYYVNNRCELVCVDALGFLDGENDGIQDEQYKGDDKADIVWSYDMMEELFVFPHNLATSSPLIAGDLVLLLTGNGVDEGHLSMPSPTAPAFIAVDKNTGKLVWEFSDIGNVLHGQWSSPAYGVVGGEPQVVFPGGDGWVYAIDARTGKLIWKFDCNPKGSVWKLGGSGTRNNLIATPVIHDNAVFIGVGQDPEHGTGIGHLYRIDATGKGDVTESGRVWHMGGEDFGRTMTTVAIRDGLLYTCDLGGYFYCVDAKTGKLYWKHDLMAAVWGSPMIVDGKVYIGDEDGDVLIVKHSKIFEVINEVNMGSAVYTTPSPANGVLYIATRSHLYAIANP
ncbi:MAG: PQQ-binding-like beta-propeller repeat protein [Verrucomicrobia bacterium]|nr:PQQ-binding-like beta-propeller repeat protein [Verrucomicrobiota bacterium]